MVQITNVLQNLGLSFSGSGFLLIYQLGAVSSILEHGQPLMKKVTCFAGTSGGSLVATLIAIVPDKLQDIVNSVYSISENIRKKPLGGFTPRYHLTEDVKDVLVKTLPSDAYYYANHRIFVSVTSITHRRNYLFSEFKGNQDFIQCLLCSCFIPIYNGIEIPTYHGMKCIDGCYTDNLPRFPHGRTIVVTPFIGETDVCPENPTKQKPVILKNQKMVLCRENIIRFSHSLFPPTTDIMEKYYEEGKEDACKFLKKEGWFS